MKGELGQWLAAVTHIRIVLEWTVGKLMRGEVEAAWVLGGKDCWKYKSNFSRMEGIVSRGKDKQTK